MQTFMGFSMDTGIFILATIIIDLIALLGKPNPHYI